MYLIPNEFHCMFQLSIKLQQTTLLYFRVRKNWLSQNCFLCDLTNFAFDERYIFIINFGNKFLVFVKHAEPESFLIQEKYQKIHSTVQRSPVQSVTESVQQTYPKIQYAIIDQFLLSFINHNLKKKNTMNYILIFLLVLR